MANMTLADLVKLNDRNTADYEISDLLLEAPLLKRLAAAVASNGTSHQYLKQTGAPGVGFRAIDTGQVNAADADTLVTVALKYLDCSWEIDRQLADGAIKGREWLATRKTARSLMAGMFKLEQQIVNGGTGGFDGFAQALATVGDSYMVTSAGGSGSTLSSVYAIRTGENDCQVIIGNDGMISIGDPTLQRSADGSNYPFDVYRCSIVGWSTLQVGGKYSIARLANIAASTQTLTDDLLATLLSLFPSGKMPDFLAMSRRSLMQLQQSRTATNATGAPAPFPSEAFGVPIVACESITNTEITIGATPTPTA